MNMNFQWANPLVFDIPEATVSATTLPAAYHMALMKLQRCGVETDCVDWNTKQKEISMTMCVANPLQEPMISRCFIGGAEELEQYVLEMTDGILDFEVERGKWAYTYHQRYADQIPFVIDELKRNPSSRRAVMVIRDKNTEMYNDDVACLQHVHYFVRGGKLCCKVLFRSNDACKATFMNAFALIMLQKKIADELGVEVGSYVHRANSFHCYAKDYNLLDGYCARIEAAEDEDDITYEYVGDWKDDMDAAIPSIMRSVQILKERK